MNDTIAVAITQRLNERFVIDVAFEVPASGVTALLGRSGSGKTSVLRALAGLDHPAGTVRFRDEIWQDETRFVPAHRRRIGYVFQGMGLLPHLSVRGNLIYARRRAQSDAMTYDAIVTRTGIADLLDRKPARLSGGELQRASIARALLSQPRLLLMDEPLSALDPDERARMVGELHSLFEGLAIPVFYVTHDAQEARRLARRSILLHDGRVLADARQAAQRLAR